MLFEYPIYVIQITYISFSEMVRCVFCEDGNINLDKQ